MAATIEIFNASIVAVGNFNTAIFSPDWLEKNKLIGRDDAEAARNSDNLLISKPVARFETEWLAFQVIGEQLSLQSKGAVTPALRDLAIGIFTLVPHTPISGLGLNFLAHFKLDSEDLYHRIGDALAPKQIWQAIFPGEAHSLGTETLVVVVEPYKRGEAPTSKDKLRITVQPSGMIPKGILISYNDHHEFDAEKQKGTLPGDWAKSIVEKKWELSWENALRIFQNLIEIAGKP